MNNQTNHSKLGKRDLEKKVSKIHKSTKTSFWRLTRFHDWLREHVRWYYKWHLFKTSNVLHWIVLIIVIAGFVFLASSLLKINRENSELTEDWTIIGQRQFSEIGLINIKIVNGKPEIDDKEKGFGILKIKKSFSDPAIWKTISWDANIPSGTTIMAKTRFSNEDCENSWTNAKWSDFYSISPSLIVDDIKNPSPRSKNLEAEIILQGGNGNSPSLNWIKVSYIPYQKPSGVSYFIAEKIVNFLNFIYDKIDERFGHTF